MRSRVIPGSSPTIDRRLAVNRLNSVLLPTLGRPTIATSGSFAAPAFTGTTDLRYVGKGGSSSETVEDAPPLQCTVRFMPATHHSARAFEDRILSAAQIVRVFSSRRAEIRL